MVVELPVVLELRGLSKQFRTGGGVLDIDLRVNQGERLAILGPSGSGKSTLLRLIAGLEVPDSGSISINGNRAEGLAPRDRGLSLVLQDQPPYPHLNVAQNVGFGLRLRGVREPERSKRVREVAAGLRLSGFEARRPGTLSGGEQRRVVLGRALATRSKLLLLDEPLSALDRPLRRALRRDLIRFQESESSTMILVTHDQDEAMAFGNQVAVIRAGRIEQVGTPDQLLKSPKTRFVAEFLSPIDLAVWRCQIRSEEQSIKVEGILPGASWWVPIEHEQTWPALFRISTAAPVDLGIPPEAIEMLDPGALAGEPGSLSVVGRVERIDREGWLSYATVRIGHHTIRLKVDEPERVELSDRIGVRLLLHRAFWFDPESGQAIGPRAK